MWTGTKHGNVSAICVNLKAWCHCICAKSASFCFFNPFFRTLPESPPDSSSEPYSPQQVNGEWRVFLHLPTKSDLRVGGSGAFIRRKTLSQWKSAKFKGVCRSRRLKSISVTYHFFVFEQNIKTSSFADKNRCCMKKLKGSWSLSVINVQFA